MSCGKLQRFIRRFTGATRRHNELMRRAFPGYPGLAPTALASTIVMSDEKLQSAAQLRKLLDDEVGSPMDYIVPGSEIRINDTVVGTVPWVSDHRALLKKYMEHVVAREGDDLLRYIGTYSDWPTFTDNERRELEEISRELGNEVQS